MTDENTAKQMTPTRKVSFFYCTVSENIIATTKIGNNYVAIQS